LQLTFIGGERLLFIDLKALVDILFTIFIFYMLLRVFLRERAMARRSLHMFLRSPRMTEIQTTLIRIVSSHFHSLYYIDAVIIVVVGTSVMRPALLAPYDSTFGGDVLSFWTFLSYVLRKSLLQFGEVPLWNPYYFSGMPYVANPQTSPFYLSTLLILPFGEVDGIRWAVILHVMLSGLNMYYLAVTLRQRRLAALVSALGYMFSGYLIARIAIGHITFVYGYCWAPLAFAFCEKAVTRSSLWYALLAGSVLALQTLSGALILLGYTSLLLVAYLIYSCLAYARRFSWWSAGDLSLRSNENPVHGGKSYSRFRVIDSPMAKLLLIGVTICLATFSLSAVKVLPLLEFASETARFAERGGILGGIPGIRALYDVFLERRVQAYHDVYGFGWWEFSSYMGGFLFLSVGAILLRPRSRHTVFFALISFLGILFAMGMHSPFHGMIKYLYDSIPLFSALFHLPARAIFVTVLSLSVLSGITLSAVVDHIERKEKKRKRLRLNYILLSAALVVVVVDLGRFAASHFGTVPLPSARPYTSTSPNDLSVSWLEYPVEIVARPRETFNVSVKVENIGDTIWLKDSHQPVLPGNPWYLSKGTVHLGIIVDRWDYRFPLPRNIPPGEVAELTATLRTPDYAGKYSFRVNLVNELIAWFSPPYPSGTLTVTSSTYERLRTITERTPINAYSQQYVVTWLSKQNHGDYFRIGPYSSSEGRLYQMSVRGLFHVGGYETGGMLVPSYSRFTSNLSARKLGLLNVRYVIFGDGVDDSSFHFIGKFGDWTVYENRECLPRAFIVNHAILVVGKEREASEFEDSLLNAKFFDPSRIGLVRGGSLYARDYNPEFLARFDLVVMLPHGNEGEELNLTEKCGAIGVPVMRYSKDAWPFLVNSVTSMKTTTGNQGEITYYSPNKVVVRVRNHAPGFLVLSEVYFPGWKAHSDGREVPIMIAFSTLRCVPLTETGEREVSFLYLPGSYVAGVVISVTSVILIVAMAIRNRRSRGGYQSSQGSC